MTSTPPFPPRDDPSLALRLLTALGTTAATVGLSFAAPFPQGLAAMRAARRTADRPDDER